MSGRVLPVVGSTGPWSSGAASPSAYCVLAPNASPWTLDGTNTWLLTAPGSSSAVVVDPGPDAPAHLSAVQRAADERDVVIGAIILTHGHVDHAEGARSLAEATGAGVRALDPAHRLGAEGLAGGDVVDMGEWRIDVVATPGHSGDSVCLSVPHDHSVLTGDTVLGRGTSLVAWPDGLLGEYLDSLRSLRRLCETEDVRVLLPGHGPVLDDPSGVVGAYLEHRLARLDEVREVMASGVTSPEAIVAVVYADVPRQVWPAAELTVRAQLHYLANT